METNKLGKLQTLTLDLERPIKMNCSMDINNFNLMTGKNGVGKTIILKYNWLLSSLMYIIVMMEKNTQTPEAVIEIAQFYLDHSFDDHNTHGKFSCTFTSMAELEIVCVDGKVVGVNTQKDASITIATQPIYMSAETRLMTDIVRYLRFCGSHEVAFEALTEENLMKILGLYKIYDVFFMEGLLVKIRNGLSEEQQKRVQEYMSKFDEEFIIQDIKVTDKNDDIVMTKDGETWTSVRTLGAGHQALLTMCLGGPL